MTRFRYRTTCCSKLIQTKQILVDFKYLAVLVADKNSRPPKMALLYLPPRVLGVAVAESVGGCIAVLIRRSLVSGRRGRQPSREQLEHINGPSLPLPTSLSHSLVYKHKNWARVLSEIDSRVRN